jgi:hypothetical protein
MPVKLYTDTERSVDDNRKLKTAVGDTETLRKMLATVGSWEERTTAVSAYLAGNLLYIGMPRDDCKLFINSCIQRGNEHAIAREKCWKHILIEVNSIVGLENCAPADLIYEDKHYLDITTPPLQSEAPQLVEDTEAKVTTESTMTGAVHEVAQEEFKFHSTSNAEKGRFIVRDSQYYQPDIFRQRDRGGGSGQKGVTLVKGYRTDNGKQEVISIIFDRSHYDEDSAAAWWCSHRQRFLPPDQLPVSMLTTTPAAVIDGQVANSTIGIA